MPKRPPPIRPAQHQPRPLMKDFAQWRYEAASSEYALEAIRVIQLAATVSRQEYLEMMAAMDQKYPGLGWAVDDLPF